MAVNTTVEVVMPQMGDSVSEGTVLEWHKNEGDQVSQDETLVEISTDKVDAEVPAPIAGTVVKVHASEGDTVTVGSVLAEISPTNGSGPAATEEPAGADEGTSVDITMPAMGESVTEGVVLEGHKQPGDAVAQDETIVEISTDKVDAEVPAPAAGTMGEILAQAGETVEVGQVLARMQSGGNGSAPAPKPTSAPRPAGDAVASSAGPSLRGPEAETVLPEGTKATPVARRVAAAHGVDLGAVKGSGPAGRIGKDDVLAAANGSASNGATATKPENATLLKGASAMLARYMDESRSIPTATSFRTITVTALDGRRKQLK